MANAPYRIVDRRSSSGFNSANTLIEAATQTADRQAAPQLDYDFHRTVTNLGRRTLMSLGRYIFWRFPALQGAILEQANVAVSTYIPQFAGADKEWGKLAEQALQDWHGIMDVAGWPYDYDSYLQQLIIAPIVEGENFTLLCETTEGYPMIQVIPAHRVGARTSAATIAKVRYFQEKMWIDDKLVDSNRPYLAETRIEIEAKVIDGVIVDDFARPIAYRVYSDNFTSGEYQDIPARNMFPAFCPMATGQVRGFSLLASSVFDWQDMHEWRRFEMLAQKIFSTQTIIEQNETGDTDTAKALISQAATFDDAGAKTALDVQKLDGGTIRYLRANTGSKLEQFEYDRPGGNSQNFMGETLRNAFKGTEWDVFFSLDPQKVGGAPMRVIVEKINMVAAKRRKLVRKCCLRIDGYAIAKFMKLGILPWNDEWYKWNYQGPGDITADKKYDSDVDLAEIGANIGTRRDAIARRGGDPEDVRTQVKREAEEFLTDAGELAKTHGITIQEAIAILRPPASGLLPVPPKEAGEAPTSTANERE